MLTVGAGSSVGACRETSQSDQTRTMFDKSMDDVLE